MVTYKCVECRLRKEDVECPAVEVRNRDGYPELYCDECYMYSTQDVKRIDTDFLKDWDSEE